MSYAEIKQLKSDLGIKRVGDLLALAQQNDPFYVGGAASLRDAQWFLDLWNQFAYTSAVHLRRIHYQIVSQDPLVIRGDGKEYQNTDNSWGYLCDASKYARYLGYVSLSDFVDKKKPATKENAKFSRPGGWDYIDPEPGYEVEETINTDEYTIPELPEIDDLENVLPSYADFIVNGYYKSDYGFDPVEQGVMVEVWIEKSTMDDILVPLCERYNVNLVTGVGELSITSVNELFGRIEYAGLPTRILYISDFDPAGLQMPVSVARKIEYFQRSGQADGIDIRLQPIALTPAQVRAYKLPRVPVKDSDLRKGKFEDIHGAGAVELDALEALHPGEFKEIVERNILQYYDKDIASKTRKVRRALIDKLDSERDEILNEHEDETDEIDKDYDQLKKDYASIQEKFNDLVEELQPEIEEYQERMDKILERVKKVNGKVIQKLGGVDVDLDDDDFALPEPEYQDENDYQLYESERGYLEQIDSYKHHKNGG